jgi:hypothetical protein
MTEPIARGSADGQFNLTNPFEGFSAGMLAGKGLFVGVSAEGGVNTFNGWDAGFGGEIGYGKVVALNATGIGSMSQYEYVSGTYHYFPWSRSHQVGVKWTMPSLDIAKLGLWQLRVPFSIGLFGQFGKNTYTDHIQTMVEVPTYTGIDEPPQTTLVAGEADVSTPGPFYALFARPTVGVDILPFSAKLPLCFAVHAGPEIGFGSKAGQPMPWIGASVMASATLFFNFSGVNATADDGKADINIH